MRLVVSRVVAADGGVQAEWLLATNVADEGTAARVAPWYAWRWRIESFFKLLKGHGQPVESWQQESGRAIAKRLAVTAMACVLVWQVVRDDTPAGRAVARRLVRLSGRQMKRSRPVTAPAVLAGLEKLLAVLALLDETTVEELRSLLHQVLPPPPGYGSLCRYLWCFHRGLKNTRTPPPVPRSPSARPIAGGLPVRPEFASHPESR